LFSSSLRSSTPLDVPTSSGLIVLPIW